MSNLLNGALTPNLLNILLLPVFNKFRFLLSHIAHFDNIIILPLLVLEA